MRRQGLYIACMLVGLGVASERAIANGVIVVPVTTTVLVPKIGIVQQAPANGPAYKGQLRRLFKRRSVPACETTTYYELTTVQSAVLVLNPKRPCYPPRPTPSPQAPGHPFPSPQSPHDHAAPSAQAAAPGGCGRCWPRCFIVPRADRCTCCIHMKRDVRDQAEASEIVDRINKGQLEYVPIHWTPYVADAVADAVPAADPPGPDPIPCPPPAR